MNVRSILKGSGLVTASAALIALVTLVGILVFTFYNISDRDGSASIREISAALTWDGTAYSFSGEDLLDDGHWAMLVNEDGQVASPPTCRSSTPSRTWPPSPGGISAITRYRAGFETMGCWWQAPQKGASGSMTWPWT